MTITRKLNGNTLRIAVAGRLDTLTAPELKEEIQKGLDGAENLVWDFTDLEYISSAGFRVLLSQGMLDDPDKMKVARPNEMVRTAFMLTGLGDLLMEE